jgi:hypothetical protein
MPCPCCGSLCSSILNGTDWNVALDISCWGGNLYPGRTKLMHDGVVDLDIEVLEWNWFLYNETRRTPGEPGQDGQESKFFSAVQMLRPTATGPYTDADGVSWEILANVTNTNQTLDIHLNDLTGNYCILYGHIGVEYGFRPLTNTYTYTSEQIQQVYNYATTWRWQVPITGRSLGSVSCTPVIALKNYYTGVIFEDGSYESAQSTAIPIGPVPEVTITLAP